MSIEYRDVKEFDIDSIRSLFTSVGLKHGKEPDKVQFILESSDKVYSAWDGDCLVGLISSLCDDGVTAYFHYFLVKPDFQGRGIGLNLMKMMFEHYEDLEKKAVVLIEGALDFYKKCGFETDTDEIPAILKYPKI